jgi:hypothetical protein
MSYKVREAAVKKNVSKKLIFLRELLLPIVFLAVV